MELRDSELNTGIPYLHSKCVSKTIDACEPSGKWFMHISGSWTGNIAIEYLYPS